MVSIGKLQLLKRNSTKDIYLNFSGNFQSSSFSENHRKTFLETCRFYITGFFLANVFTGNYFREHSEEIIFVESTFLLKPGILVCKFVMLEKKGQFCNGF